MSRYNNRRYYDDGNVVYELDEVLARYRRGEVVEALYELEKLIPELIDIHKYASDEKKK